MFPVILLWLKPDSWELASVGRTPAQKVRSENSGYISPRVCYACLLCNANLLIRASCLLPEVALLHRTRLLADALPRTSNRTSVL